jgi:hypothetical protein
MSEVSRVRSSIRHQNFLQTLKDDPESLANLFTESVERICFDGLSSFRVPIERSKFT